MHLVTSGPALVLHGERDECSVHVHVGRVRIAAATTLPLLFGVLVVGVSF